MCCCLDSEITSEFWSSVEGSKSLHSFEVFFWGGRHFSGSHVVTLSLGMYKAQRKSRWSIPFFFAPCWGTVKHAIFCSCLWDYCGRACRMERRCWHRMFFVERHLSSQIGKISSTLFLHTLELPPNQ